MLAKIMTLLFSTGKYYHVNELNLDVSIVTWSVFEIMTKEGDFATGFMKYFLFISCSAPSFLFSCLSHLKQSTTPKLF